MPPEACSPVQLLALFWLIVLFLDIATATSSTAPITTMPTLTTTTNGPSSQTTTPSSSTSAPSSNRGLATGAIIGIVVSVLISVVIFIVAIFLYLFKRGCHRKPSGTFDNEGHSRPTTDVDQVELKHELSGEAPIPRTSKDLYSPNTPSHASQIVGPSQNNDVADRSLDSSSVHSTGSTDTGGVPVFE